jgi:hypothetical protein
MAVTNGAYARLAEENELLRTLVKLLCSSASPYGSASYQRLQTTLDKRSALYQLLIEVLS